MMCTNKVACSGKTNATGSDVIIFQVSRFWGGLSHANVTADIFRYEATMTWNRFENDGGAN